MTLTDINELLDYVTDHISLVRNNDDEDEIIAATTRAILRLQQLRAVVSQEGLYARKGSF